jgi:hypothetical protein
MVWNLFKKKKVDAEAATAIETMPPEPIVR